MLTIDYRIPTQYTHSVNTVMHPSQDIFEIYNSDKTIKMGELVCHKTNIVTRPDYKGPILAIDFIKSNEQNRGLGTAIINFAHKISEQMGCNGYMVLKADSTLQKDKIPHLFYRKLGFSTLDKKTDKRMDKFIKHSKIATSKDFPSMVMQYPSLPKNITKTKITYKTILKYLSSILR